MRPAAAPTAPTDGAARPAEAADTPADDVSMLCASTMPSAQQATRAANLDHAAPPELSTGSQPVDDPAELDVYIDRYEQLLEDVRGMLDLDDGRPSSPPAQLPAPPPAEVPVSGVDAPEVSTAQPAAAAPSPAELPKRAARAGAGVLDGPGKLQWELEPLRERNRALRERLRALQ